MDFKQLSIRSLHQACSTLVPAPQACAEVSPSSSDSRVELSTAAVMGFSNGVVRGTLGIAVSPQALVRLGRAMAAVGETVDEYDALGELANLVLGHVKRSWLQHGVSVTVATPVVVRGVSIEICEARDAANWCKYSTHVETDRVLVWLDAVVPDTLETSPQPNRDVTFDEGDVLFF